MLLLRLFRLMFAFMAPSIVEEGGGGAPSPAAPEVSAPAVADVPDTPAAPEGPATGVEAMWGKETAAEIENLRGKGPRDPLGKFVPKVAGDVPAVPVATKPAAPAAPVVPGAPPVAKTADDLAMPEGLAPKAQERFQRLANEVRELRQAAAPVADLTEKLDTATRQIEYVKTAFHEHAVRPEQFEQATAVIGMINRGDLAGAQKALTQQLQQISLMTGQPVAPIDALANFPDLREAVDGMQITEAMALEIARGRAERFAGEQRQQRSQQEQQSQQQTQQAVQSGTKAVDDFCKRMQGSDVDYSAVEEQLLPEIPNLIRGAHPSQWAGIVEANYRLLKNAAGKFRQPAPSSAGNVLRPTGQGSPGQAPSTGFEAMWGHRQTA